MNLRFLFPDVTKAFCALVILAQTAFEPSAPQAVAQEPSVLTLKDCTPLPQPISMHGCVIVGNRFYVLGGNAEDKWQTAVISADIRKPGELGSWRMERPLPQERFYIGTSIEAFNDCIYIVGGAVLNPADNKRVLHAADILWTRVQSDGTLGEWQQSPAYATAGSSCAASCSTERALFVSGGYDGRKPRSEIVRCDLGPDGVPVRWHPAGALPVPLWYHGAAILNDRMYVWGGLTGPKNESTHQKVYSAVVRNGEIGPWSEETPLPAGVYSSAFCGFNDYLVGIAGRYQGGHPTNVIWFSRLENGRLGPWQMMKTDLESTTFLAAGLDRRSGVVYVAGGQQKLQPGRGNGKPLARVQAFHLSQPQAAQLHLAGQAAASGASWSKLPQAVEASRKSGKEVMAFFYSPEVPACKKFSEELEKRGILGRLQQRYALAAVDVSGAESEYSYQYAVFRVPCLVRISPQNQVVEKTFSLDQLKDF